MKGRVTVEYEPDWREEDHASAAAGPGRAGLDERGKRGLLDLRSAVVKFELVSRD